MTLTIAGRYQIVQKIGAGGMGNVYQGHDQRLNVPVAIKMLRSELATPETINRFIREGEALRQLNHPNIVTLLDAVEERGEHYLIMELVEGGTLDDLLRKSFRLTIPRILNLALDLTDALTRAHRLNIIHRDIKPANVLLNKDGTPRLTDFGIAHFNNSDATQAGTVMGTTAYIAPEVLQGERADVRSDIWSLGIMLYEMVAGDHPFKATNPGTLIRAILTQPLPQLETQRPDVPVALLDLIQRMTVKEPAERIPRMRLVGIELETLLAGDSHSTVEIHTPQPPYGESPQQGRFATPSPLPSQMARHKLPVQITPFVGRENELAELDRIIRTPSVRVLTILAPGGMGKTRLSLELANKLLHQTRSDTFLEHGCYFVDLAPLTSAKNIIQAVAEAVDYSFQDDGRQSQQQILDYLREKNLLLIMDNFEHVMDGRALVQEILQEAPLVKMVITSREKLNISAETVFILEGMDFPTWETPEDALQYGAVKLFMQSAQRVRSGFILESGDLNYVSRICRMVYGAPLGILLAAAWLESLSLSEIVQELNRSFDFLETEMHDLPERQRSLRAVFEYSWRLLTESEQTLFARFSLFRGGFTREAGQTITGATLRTLTTLINKSLLRRDNTSGRFAIHELLRQYAEEKLIALGEVVALSGAHSQHYLGMLAQLTSRLKGQGQLAALNVIEADFENIRTAWLWACETRSEALILSAVEGAYLFLSLRNRSMDGEQLFRAARQKWPVEGDNPPLLAAKVLVRFPDGSPKAAFVRGLNVAQKHGDPFEIAFCQTLLGHWVSHSEYNQVEGIPLLEAGLQGFESFGDKYYVAKGLDDLGWSHNLNMDLPNQRVVVERSLNLRREIGDQIGTANSMRNMGGASGGFFDTTGRAVGFWREAKALCYQMNDRLGIAWNACLEASVFVFQGEFEKSRALIDEGYPHAKEINDPVVKGYYQILRGILEALQHEDYQSAKALIIEGYPLQAAPDFRLITAIFATVIVCCGTGDFQLVKHYLNKTEGIAPFHLREFYTPMVMSCLVASLELKGMYARAVELMYGFEAGITSYVDLPVPTAWIYHWGWYKRLRAKAESALGSEAFQAAIERGRHLSMDEMSSAVKDFITSM